MEKTKLISKKEKEDLIKKIDELRRKKIDKIHEKLKEFYQLVDEFDYEKNGIEITKDFIKYLLFELYWQATKK